MTPNPSIHRLATAGIAACCQPVISAVGPRHMWTDILFDGAPDAEIAEKGPRKIGDEKNRGRTTVSPLRECPLWVDCERSRAVDPKWLQGREEEHIEVAPVSSSFAAP